MQSRMNPSRSPLDPSEHSAPFHDGLFGRELFIVQNLDGETVHRLLDFGCGPGALTKKISARYGTMAIVACDIDGDIIETARMDAPHNVDFDVIQPFGPWPWPDKTFDVVVLGDVLEHVPDESYILSEAARVLADEGRIILTVPHRSLTGSLDPANFRFRWPALHRIIYSLAHGRTAYRRRYTRPEPFNSSPGVTWHRHYTLPQLVTLLSHAHLDVDRYGYWGRLDALLLLWEMVQRNVRLPWPRLSARRCRQVAQWNSQPAPPLFAYNLGVVARGRR